MSRPSSQVSPFPGLSTNIFSQLSPMAKHYQGVPSSFFMFCYGPMSKLNIPVAFAEEHRNFLLQGSLKLTTESGRSWKVKIVRSRNSSSYEFQIGGGWSEFVYDNELVERDFLIFRIVGRTALHVSIFRKQSCMEEIPSPATPPSGEEQANTWSLVKRLTLHKSSKRVDIPRRFVQLTHISTKSKIFLKNGKGMKWQVTMTTRKKTKYSLTKGWAKFLKANKFKVGDILLFEFVGDNVIDVVGVDEEVGRRLIRRAKKGGLLYHNTKIKREG